MTGGTEGYISRGRFIRLGSALGFGAAGASLLASCGGSGGEEGGSQAEAIASESEVEPGSAVEFQSEGEAAVLVRLENGDFAAYSAVCTHQGCEVAYNEEEGTLDCPCHGSVFDPAQNGEPQGGPAQRPLPEISVEVQNGEVVQA